MDNQEPSSSSSNTMRGGSSALRLPAPGTEPSFRVSSLMETGRTPRRRLPSEMPASFSTGSSSRNWNSLAENSGSVSMLSSYTSSTREMQGGAGADQLRSSGVFTTFSGTRYYHGRDGNVHDVSSHSSRRPSGLSSHAESLRSSFTPSVPSLPPVPSPSRRSERFVGVASPENHHRRRTMMDFPSPVNGGANQPFHEESPVGVPSPDHHHRRRTMMDFPSPAIGGANQPFYEDSPYRQRSPHPPHQLQLQQQQQMYRLPNDGPASPYISHPQHRQNYPEQHQPPPHHHRDSSRGREPSVIPQTPPCPPSPPPRFSFVEPMMETSVVSRPSLDDRTAAFTVQRGTPVDQPSLRMDAAAADKNGDFTRRTKLPKQHDHDHHEVQCCKCQVILRVSKNVVCVRCPSCQAVSPATDLHSLASASSGENVASLGRAAATTAAAAVSP